MIDVGIDIGKHSHLVALSGEDAAKQTQPQVFSIENTPAGRAGLISRLAATAADAGGGCRIALEQIGGWVGPLDRQLLAAGHQLVTIHPLRLARARDLFGQPHKTDQRDALVLLSLLQYARRGLVSVEQAKQLRPVIGLTPELEQLKQLSRHYHQLSGQHQQLSNRLGQLTAVWLPALTEIFSAVTGWGCLGLLSQAPCPSRWPKLHRATIVSWFRRANHSRCLGFKLAGRVKVWAQAGNWEKLPAGRALMTLPGCGLVLGATILSELSPFERFKSHHQVAMYVGLTRLRHESGLSRNSRKPSLVNRRAKWAFRQLALINRQHCPLSQAYVARHLDQGKTPKRAHLALGRQLVKVAVALIKTGQPFNPDRL